MPRETVMEARKLEGRVLLKSAAMKRAEDYHRLKRGLNAEGRPLSDREKEWLARRVESHDLLAYLTDAWLRERSENPYYGRDRARYQLMHRASRAILLTEYEAGGYHYLEHLEKLGKHNHTIRTAAGFARQAIEEILDELDRRDFRLEVDQDRKSKDKYEAMVQDRRVLARQDDSYRQLAAERRELVCGGMAASEATQAVAKKHDVAPSKVYRAVKFVREENNKECAR
jgi:hypothetical protein